MIAEHAKTQSAPRVPIDDWRPARSERASNLAMKIVANAAGVLSTIIGSRAGESLGILTYHRIVPQVSGTPAPPYNVTPESLHEQLVGLMRRGFRFVSLREVLASHDQDKPLPRRSVVLSFDDCFESVYTYAWPILQELKVPATLFVSTAYLDSNSPFPFDTWGIEFRGRVPMDHFRPIRTEQCQEMMASGLIDIGTHTHTHADFRQHVAEFSREMQIAAELVKLRFGETDPLFAFPYGNPHTGYASPELLVAAQKSGARCALTTECSLVAIERDPFGWGRINVFDWDASFTLAGKLTGWYDWAPRLKHRVQNTFRRRYA